MSSSSSSSSSSSAESVSSGESSSARRKRLKKEKKAKKKEKKLEKKLKKKEKKLAKKEKKRAKKEGKKGGGKRERSPSARKRERSPSAPQAARQERRDASPDGRKKRRRSPSSDAGPKPVRAPVKPHVAFDGSIEEACDLAARGIKTGGKTVEDDEIMVKGPDGDLIENPDVFKTFREIRDFPRDLLSSLSEAGFPGPSQIQAYCWPLGLRGKDVIGIAATGSGKTLAFLLPAFIEMDREGIRPERDGPGLLVMAPTRELAQQTETEANRFGRSLRMKCVAMYGGAPKGQQMAKYRSGCAVVVACPGRLNDFLEGRQVNLRNARRLVLDEADRMLDMGFEPQIRKILEHVPKRRHTLFFTATWPKEVQSLAASLLDRPYKVMIGNRDELKGNQDVTQLVEVLDQSAKLMRLAGLLQEAGLTKPGGKGKALIFSGTKKMCDQLAGSLNRSGVNCAAIHGDKDQSERDQALNGLKDGRIRVLVATDVAARGLDIKGVGLVVNFDPPGNAEDYVHRIGRTGRAGAKGFAVTMLTPNDGNKAKSILEVMERTGQKIPAKLEDLAKTGGGSGMKGGGRHKGGGKGF